MLNVRLAGDHLYVWEIAIHLAVACDVYNGVLLCCLFSHEVFFNETLNLIESVSEDFPSYSLMKKTLLILNIYYAKICLVLMSAFIQILTLIKKLKFSQTFYMITQIKFLVKYLC